jgi:hypothetical protein|tara:strand:- start:289 stop:543 length:255 start_codon:yes stop_codon:yes gene_type:complete
MDHTIVEILLGYVIAGALIIGAPGVFFLIVFMPALQNTKGRMVGYNEHVKYGNSSINTFSRTDLKVGPDVPVRQLSFPINGVNS